MKKQIRVIALVMAILLCAVLGAGCSVITATTDAVNSALQDYVSQSSPSASSQATLPPIDLTDAQATPFDEIEYTRPDAQAEADTLGSLAQQVAACGDAEQLAEIFRQGESLYGNYQTMYNLASLQYGRDFTDAVWEEEARVTAEGMVVVDEAYQEFYLSLYDSPFSEQIEEQSPGYFDGISEERDWYAGNAKELYEQEASLINDYNKALATASITYQGTEMTISDLYGIEDYDSYREAMLAWGDKYNAAFGNLYIELVKTRSQLARELGFENYTEMVFEQNEMDYTPEMMDAFIEGVVENLGPIYREVVGYYVEDTVDFETMADFLQTQLFNMDEELGSSFALMRQYGLIDYEPRNYKDSGAYTTYFQEFGSPFILMNYSGDEYSWNTLVHEFGHFNDYLTMGQAPGTIDTAETYSQGLEMLMAGSYAELLGEDTGYSAEYNLVLDKLSSMVRQPYYTAIEQEVYAMDPDALTVEAINEIALRQAVRFGLATEEDAQLYAVEWVTTPHIFEAPYYTFAYATSADVSVQLWEIARTDRAAAAETYLRLLAREKSTDFIANTEAAGLVSPFAEGETQRIAALFSRYLVEEDWTEEAVLQEAA